MLFVVSHLCCDAGLYARVLLVALGIPQLVQAHIQDLESMFRFGGSRILVFWVRSPRRAGVLSWGARWKACAPSPPVGALRTSLQYPIFGLHPPLLDWIGNSWDLFNPTSSLVPNYMFPIKAIKVGGRIRWEQACFSRSGL